MKRLAIITVLLLGLAPSSVWAEFHAKEIEAEHLVVQKRLGHLASGLESGLERDDVRVAKNLYRLEVKTARLLREATAAKSYQGWHHKRSVVSDIRSTMRMVLKLQERMLDHTIAELDRVLPGEPHRDMWARKGVDLYRPLLRTSTPKPGQPKPSRSERLTEMKKDSADARGKIHYLGPKTIKNYYGGQVFEWVQVGNRIRITDAGAKHPIIALEGRKALDPNEKSRPKSVRGAGSGMFIMGANGEPVMAIISDSSGNYKPGIGSTIGMVQKLESIGIPARRVVITHVLPGEPVIVKLLLKSKLLAKDEIKRQVTALRSQAHSERFSVKPRRNKAAPLKKQRSQSLVKGRAQRQHGIASRQARQRLQSQKQKVRSARLRAR